MKHPYSPVARHNKPSHKSFRFYAFKIRKSISWATHPLQPIIASWAELEVCPLDLLIIDQTSGELARPSLNAVPARTIRLICHICVVVSTRNDQVIHRVGGRQSC